MMNSTRKLYNKTASQWTRQERSLLSDFTGRPPVIELCEPIAGKRVLDLGCGEGYCSREVRSRGASEVVGIDISEQMIQFAQAREASNPLGIVYHTGNATDLSNLEDNSFDLIVAMFLFNYLNVEQTHQCMKEVFRVLTVGGKFVLAVPHPAFPFMRNAEPPFYFDVENYGYFSGRNRCFRGQIWRRDGVALHVQNYHKTIADYLDSFQLSGFNVIPKVVELNVKPEHIAKDEKFFSPVADMPLHMAFSIHKTAPH